MADQDAEPVTEAVANVRRRQVFFVSGYDPKGAAFYHDLYTSQAALQAGVSGYRIETSARKRLGRHIARWTVAWRQGSRQVDTTYDFLRWDDIMRQHWPRGEFAMVGIAAKTYWRYILTGVLRRVLQTSWPTFIAAIYPALLIMLMIIISALMIFLLSCASLALGAPWWAGAILGAGFGWPIFKFASPVLDTKLGMHWLVRIYAFNLKQAAREVPELDVRLDFFADHILNAIKADGIDEVLLVGHSTGAQTVCDLLARILKRDPDFARHGPAVSLLTLGGSIPMLAWLPGTEWFRQSVQAIVSEPAIGWIDFTAAQDGATFALQDPVGLMGLPSKGETPKVLSTKLFELLTPEGFRKKHHDWNYVHFHYMMASERPAEYDYFLISAGPMTLAARFAARPTTKGFSRFANRKTGKS